jgi:hypothetical protein
VRRRANKQTENVHCAAVLEFDRKPKEARRQVESEHIGAVTRELKGGATRAAADDETSRAKRDKCTHSEQGGEDERRMARGSNARNT